MHTALVYPQTDAKQRKLHIEAYNRIKACHQFHKQNIENACETLRSCKCA